MLLFWSLCLWVVANDIDAAEELSNSSSIPKAVATWKQAPKRYCGLYCVFAAAKAYGGSLEFDQLLKEEYLSSPHGSTASDLLNALEEANLHGQFVEFMPPASLERIEKPVILHVRAPGVEGRYRHWALFTGVSDRGNMNVYDPPRYVGEVSAANLMSVWDGAAIIVSESNDWDFVPPASLFFVTLLGIVAIALSLGLYRIPPHANILFAALIVTLLAHVISETGFLRSQDAVNNVRAAYLSPSIDHIGYEMLLKRMEQDAILVDARPTESFEYQHLPDAISVPINVGFLRLQATMSELSQQSEIIVYCQSNQCRWAERVARQFKSRGYTRVSIYTGGVNEWNERESSPPQRVVDQDA